MEGRKPHKVRCSKGKEYIIAATRKEIARNIILRRVLSVYHEVHKASDDI
jgi:hypothetical protein